MKTRHHRALENMYFQSPINAIYPSSIEVEERTATITMKVKPEYCHVLGTIHGSIYFKLLDDSAAFAACSINDEHPMLTMSFTTDISSPVSSGTIRASGRVVTVDGNKIYTESVMYDDKNSETARGTGLFIPAKITFAEVQAYNP